MANKFEKAIDLYLSREFEKALEIFTLLKNQ